MAQGKVKWFSNKKGYGFIALEGGQDVFVHYMDIKQDGYKTLKENEDVIFDLVNGEKGPKAQNVVKSV
ncbi:MAG: cold-shock protein [bacterium]